MGSANGCCKNPQVDANIMHNNQLLQQQQQLHGGAWSETNGHVNNNQQMVPQLHHRDGTTKTTTVPILPPTSTWTDADDGTKTSKAIGSVAIMLMNTFSRQTKPSQVRTVIELQSASQQSNENFNIGSNNSNGHAKVKHKTAKLVRNRSLFRVDREILNMSNKDLSFDSGSSSAKSGWSVSRLVGNKNILPTTTNTTTSSSTLYPNNNKDKNEDAEDPLSSSSPSVVKKNITNDNNNKSGSSGSNRRHSYSYSYGHILNNNNTSSSIPVMATTMIYERVSSTPITSTINTNSSANSEAISRLISSLNMIPNNAD